jgi:hypothetical protein
MREDTMINERAVLAHHEVGHAVIAYRLGFYLGPASVGEDGGFSRSEGEWGDGSRDYDAAIVYYAGYAAARRFDPSLPAYPDLCGAADDYERAALLLPTFHQENETLEQTRERVERATVELTEQHWAEISAVAEALFAESWLAGDDIDLIADAVVEGCDWVSKLAEYRARRDFVNNLPKP